MNRFKWTLWPYAIAVVVGAMLLIIQWLVG